MPAPRPRPTAPLAFVASLLSLPSTAGCRDAEHDGEPPVAAPEPEPPAPSNVREGQFAIDLGCAIVEGGRVWCNDLWFFPDALPDGQGLVPGARAIERLWAIEESLCMASAGQVRCLHPEDPLETPLPTDAEGHVSTPAGRDIRDLAWDSGRQCAVDGDGVPWCRWLPWDDEAELPPLRPYPLADIEQLEMGDDLACMRSRAGEIHCLFEVGVMLDRPELDATLADLCDAAPALPHCSEPLGERERWPAPFRVLEHGRDMAIGASHACLLDDRGTVGCLTTYAMDGAPIYGSTNEFTAIPGMPPLVQIDGSDTHVCGLSADGEVWCFGENEYGQLGDGTTQANIATTPVLAGRWPDATAVSVGFAKSCVHTPSETLCWGWIAEGLEAGPSLVPDLRASELRAFEYTTCARTDAGWRCFGGMHDPLAGAQGAARVRAADDPRGPSHECTLRDGTLSCTTNDAPPVRLADIVDAEAGIVNLCALGKGEVTCFSPTIPDLGDPPFAVPPSVEIDGDGYQGCVLDDKGRPHCWFDGDHALSSPTLDRRIVQLAVGVDVCGLDETGQVQCWGRERSTLPLPTIVEVASADALACARDEQGGVWCWGLYGASDEPIPATAPIAMAVPESAQIVAGMDHLCSRSVAGEVHCWGSESDSQRARLDPNLALRPTKVDTFTPR